MHPPQQLSRWIGTAALGCALSFGLSTAAFAGDSGKQLNTALAHAGYSAKSKNTKTVHLHLYHVINCLEGSQGKDFNVAAGNPCKGMGNGALSDLEGHPDVRKTLRQALGLATVAVQVDAYQPASRVARAVKELLLQAAAK